MTDQTLGAGAQVFIDALDVIAEDYSPQISLQLIRTLLSQIKASKRTLLRPFAKSLDQL